MAIVATIPPSGFVLAVVAVPLGAAALLASASAGPVGGGLAWVVAGLALAALAINTRGRIEVDADGLRYTSGFHSTRFAWAEVAGLGLMEVRGAGIWWYEILLRDGTGMRFTSAWRGGDRAAACIQRRSTASDAPLDRRGPVIFDPQTDTSNARPDAAQALGAPWPVVHRWLDVVEAELASLQGRLDRKQLQLVADDFPSAAAAPSNPTSGDPSAPEGTAGAGLPDAAPRSSAVAGAFVLELFSVGRASLAADEAEWPALVRAHAERIRAARAEQEAFGRDAAELALVESRLRPQLQAIDRLGAAADAVVADVGPHLRAVVVGALEEGEVILPRATMALWKCDPDAILEGAVRRLASDPRPAIEEGPHLTLRGDSRTAARLLALADHVDLDPAYGAVIAAPDQHVLLVLPVRDFADLMSLTSLELPRAASAAYDAGAKPLSPELYWWFRGALTHIPQIPDGEGTGVSVLIPDDLSGRLTGRVQG